MIPADSLLESQVPVGVVVPKLPIGRYRLLFACDSGSAPSEYSGSAWRGAFGHALKRLVCVTHEPNCAHCLLYHACTYPYIFETPPPPDTSKMRRYDTVPHPYVVEPPQAFSAESDQPYLLGVTLFGQANRYLPYVAHAFQQAAQRGIGSRRVRMRLADIQ